MTTGFNGAALVAHSGGPTAVINASLVGLIEEAQRRSIRRLYGARFGIRGILRGDFVDLAAQTPETLQAAALTPASALGTLREPLAPDGIPRMLDVFRAHDIRWFFYTGGNGSPATAAEISGHARDVIYELQVIGIPKTIDNDLYGTDHTPGYASTARFFAGALRDVGADNRALPGQADVVGILGRNTGWLAAACGMGRRREQDAPHLIYFPEQTLAPRQFLDDVERTFTRFGRCVVAVCEGQPDETGEPFGADVRPGSRGSLAMNLGHRLAWLIMRDLKIRAGSEKPGLLGRSCSAASPRDREEPRMCGAAALAAAADGRSHLMVSVVREPTAQYVITTWLVDLDTAALSERPFPVEWRHSAAEPISPLFRAWLDPLIGELPAHGEPIGEDT